jgi:hypothetical protein
MRQRDDDTTGTAENRGGVAAGERPAPPTPLTIPSQKLPLHETLPLETPVPTEAPTQPVTEPVAQLLPVAPSASARPDWLPLEAQWTARHLTRIVGGALLVLSLTGTGLLGERYYRSGTSADLSALVIALVVVLVLWGVLIASAPQLVSLRGSVLAVYASSEGETFDLADPELQVDVVSVPEDSDWAVVLRRQDDSALVLRGSDVDAVEFDPIVRHYRTLAEGRHS